MLWLFSALAVLAASGGFAVYRCWTRPLRFPDPVSDTHEARERFPERKP